MANFIWRWMATIIMQHYGLIVLDSSCLYYFMFLMCAFMEELNCGHLVQYVYDEFTGLLTLFIGSSWSGFWDWLKIFGHGWNASYIRVD